MAGSVPDEHPSDDSSFLALPGSQLKIIRLLVEDSSPIPRQYDGQDGEALGQRAAGDKMAPIKEEKSIGEELRRPEGQNASGRSMGSEGSLFDTDSPGARGEIIARSSPALRTNESSDFVHGGAERSPAPRRRQLVLQDVLLDEGVLAVQLAVEARDLTALRGILEDRLPQNSRETRARYALSVLRWFFPDGFQGIAMRVWNAYHDESILRDVLRVLYLKAEPLVGGCVAEALFPLAEGIQVPPSFLDRYLESRLGPEVPGRTRKRLKMNLGKLGFLSRSRIGGDRIAPVAQAKYSFLILLHHFFAPEGSRTIEVAHLLADPFWKYLGLKSEDSVRALLRDADGMKWLGKYVVADQLEQVTTCYSLSELLARRPIL